MSQIYSLAEYPRWPIYFISFYLPISISYYERTQNFPNSKLYGSIYIFSKSLMSKKNVKSVFFCVISRAIHIFAHLVFISHCFIILSLFWTLFELSEIEPNFLFWLFVFVPRQKFGAISLRLVIFERDFWSEISLSWLFNSSLIKTAC